MKIISATVYNDLYRTDSKIQSKKNKAFVAEKKTLCHRRMDGVEKPSINIKFEFKNKEPCLVYVN